jgi:hypothetical protein
VNSPLSFRFFFLLLFARGVGELVKAIGWNETAGRGALSIMPPSNSGSLKNGRTCNRLTRGQGDPLCPRAGDVAKPRSGSSRRAAGRPPGRRRTGSRASPTSLTDRQIPAMQNHGSPALAVSAPTSRDGVNGPVSSPTLSSDPLNRCALDVDIPTTISLTPFNYEVVPCIID